MTSEHTTQATQPAPRLVAGRYALLAELGRGGMGVVWRAEDRVIGRHVAVKELRLPDGAEDTVFGERVLREVRTGGRLNDPAVVTVFDVVAEHGSTFIVMELVEAPTLSELVRHRGPLPPAQVADLGRQVLTALQAAHAAGIVHRDVKPGNIMVAPNGRVKLTDFGIAQAVDDPRLTTSGMIIGSPAFMAPERVAGEEAVPASDLWSLGATLFFAAEGTLAFERPTTAATLHAILHEVPYLTRVQGPLAAAIMGLLIANPQARISAEQAHQLLAMAATPQPTLPHGAAAWSGPVPTKVAPAPRRSRPWWIAAAVAAVVLLAGGFVLGDRWATPDADQAMRPTQTYGTGGDIPTFVTSSSYPCLKIELGSGGVRQDDWNDCDELHFAELYDTATTYDSTDSDAVKPGYPDRLRTWAEARCAMTFYSDAVKDRTGLSYQALVPSKQAWETQTENSYSSEPVRKVYCLASRPQAFPGAVSTPLK
ncbi:hypothetical protein FHX82_002530 [Amycolatopsis bartoniae]|uniref:non-specific serine/threonine protein kinase n=1 Tax=Amycolatopsis bartoniae TaxID=941986 RepID=A0A8H9MG06_9PSEU|nr:serine/threonine-protein kinase [Amycolatopsis bartoniae]MBB2935476.1 hypothetical protein [Amycolatopsis bartoniae]TVT04489.1 serine/threonine protein kinase [Amycolatopsis bartoniae]GHF76276.1 serine/threonine protein kinase [Amycolatopsis bartoniae]